MFTGKFIEPALFGMLDAETQKKIEKAAERLVYLIQTKQFLAIETARQKGSAN